MAPSSTSCQHRLSDLNACVDVAACLSCMAIIITISLVVVGDQGHPRPFSLFFTTPPLEGKEACHSQLASAQLLRPPRSLRKPVIRMQQPDERRSTVWPAAMAAIPAASSPSANAQNSFLLHSSDFLASYSMLFSFLSYFSTSSSFLIPFSSSSSPSPKMDREEYRKAFRQLLETGDGNKGYQELTCSGCSLSLSRRLLLSSPSTLTLHLHPPPPPSTSTVHPPPSTSTSTAPQGIRSLRDSHHDANHLGGHLPATVRAATELPLPSIEEVAPSSPSSSAHPPQAAGEKDQDGPHWGYIALASGAGAIFFSTMVCAVLTHFGCIKRSRGAACVEWASRGRGSSLALMM